MSINIVSICSFKVEYTHQNAHRNNSEKDRLAFSQTCYSVGSNLQSVSNEDTRSLHCTLIFLFFSIKGQNGCMNRLMQTTAKKTQTVVFPIELNKDQKQIQ